MDTIKVPRNLGQITDRLPKANYNPIALKRNSSEPNRIGARLARDLQSARPGEGACGLGVIKESREEARSADPRKTKEKAMKQPYEYRLRNEAKGYRDEKENLKLPRIQEKSYLQKQGAAILAAGINQSKNYDYNSNKPPLANKYY